jgi:menaquinone-9 beta-reductase
MFDDSGDLPNRPTGEVAPMDSVDAVVIGGGPGGATTALRLAQAGWSVILVERKVFPRRKVCGEYLSATNWPLLQLLGVSEAFADLAGPPVTRTAIMVGETSTEAALPRTLSGSHSWGRALSRQHLDTLLLARASSEGVDVRQPWRCTAWTRTGDHHVCRIASLETRQSFDVRARVVIAAHGSWELGPLITQPRPAAPRSTDLLAFKAHFRKAALPPGLMPLLSFPDGYGGMVHCGHGLTSLSCCLRRGRLERLPRGGCDQAGDAVLQFILDSCPILRPVVDGAVREEPWLSAGPIRPGLRPCYRDGLYVVGNAAGEAHPVVAEGISMAIQSAFLLTQRLIPARSQLPESRVGDEIGRLYEAEWRQSFAPRIRAAAAIAHWAMRPRLMRAAIPFLRRWPRLLTWGAKLSGKVRLVVPSAAPIH